MNSVSKYQESYKILQTIDQEKVSNSDLLNQILFYQGLLDHLYAKKPDAALFYFNQVLEQTTETDIHHLQAAANVAMIYLSKGELDFAKVYVERTLKILSETDFDNLMVCIVYYDIATYYRKSRIMIKQSNYVRRVLSIIRNINRLMHWNTCFMKLLLAISN